MTDRPPEGATWIRYVRLVPLAALGFQPAFDPAAGALDWVAVLFMIAIFLPLYIAGYRADGQRQLLQVVAATAALGIAGSFVNGGASVFVIYAAALAAYVEPPRYAVRIIAALVALLALTFVISPVPLTWRFVVLAPALIFTIVTGAANVVDAERERGRHRLRLADEEIERLAALAERERIARDLHDLLGHTLSVIVVKAELAARLAQGEPARAAAEMRDVERIGREALVEVRAAVVGYRAKGLRGEVDGARRALVAAGVEATVAGDVPELPIAHETALALALRESVTNILRHARARHATIRIEMKESGPVLEVTDDGSGGAGPEGAGLTGMRERIAALGGSVQRDGRSGMRVRVSLPREMTSSSESAQATDSGEHS